MSETESFALFPTLPAELRLMIWKEALSTPISFTAVADYGASDLPWSIARSKGMAPYKVGISCKEAWSQMEKTCCEVVVRPSKPTRQAAICWLNLDCTVFYFGHGVNLEGYDKYLKIADFDPILIGLLPKLRHVALTQYYWSKIVVSCEFLARGCTVLDSIFVQDINEKEHVLSLGVNDETLQEFLDLCCKEVSQTYDSQGKLEKYSKPTTNDWKANALECFGDNPPNLYFQTT